MRPKVELAIVGRRPSLLKQAEIERAVKITLAQVKRQGEISVAFVDAGRMAKLNVAYRKKPRPTDVLSFAYHESARGPVCGDIIICPAYARDDSRQSGTPYGEQLKRLIVHGVLHIVGYDHMKDQDAKRMLPLQERIVGKL